MDPTLAQLTLGDRVWVICERHRIAQRGKIVTVGPTLLTVKVKQSSYPPQQYDRQTGMIAEGELSRSNNFFIRTELPARYRNSQAEPAYVVLEELPE